MIKKLEDKGAKMLDVGIAVGAAVYLCPCPLTH